jgi:hypothetical protein
MVVPSWITAPSPADSGMPVARAAWSQPEKPNDIKSLIDLNILKVV